MARRTRPTNGRQAPREELSAAWLDELIEEATVDAHDESEQVSGFYTMLEDRCLPPMGPPWGMIRETRRSRARAAVAGWG